MGTTFARATFYQEVQKEPLTRLGKRYGLPDNGLRNICLRSGAGTLTR